MPKSTNQGIPVHPHPGTFPCFGNVGPPYIATLSLLGITVGLPVWLFSTPIISNTLGALNAPSQQTKCLGSPIIVDPLLSTSVKYFSPPSSSSGEDLSTSN